MKKEIYIAGALVALYGVSTLAFSKPVRRQIVQRDGADVWTGETENLEAAHISHQRTDKYNTVENGRLLTTQDHYIDHFNRHGSKTLGLSEEGNKWSLNAIWSRLTDDAKAKLPPPEQVGRTIIPLPRKRV